MMYSRPTPCSKPGEQGGIRIHLSALARKHIRNARHQHIPLPQLIERPGNVLQLRAPARSSFTAYAMVAVRTVLRPTRATAVRRSVIALPDGLSATEFATLISCPARTGSVPSTLTTLSVLTVVVGQHMLNPRNDVRESQASPPCRSTAPLASACTNAKDASPVPIAAPVSTRSRCPGWRVFDGVLCDDGHALFR